MPTDRTIFAVGDRVRLSALGQERIPRTKMYTGTVISMIIGGQKVVVLFDGNVRPTTLHRSYIEMADARSGSQTEAAFFHIRDRP